MNFRALLIGLVFMLALPLVQQAQSLPEINVYRLNRLYLNPAYAGTNEDPQASLAIRQQWTGLGNAPFTVLLSADKAHSNQKLGYGFTLLNDRQGYNNRMMMNGNIAYHMPVSNEVKLSFGANVGFDWYTLQYKELVYWDQDDQVFSNRGKSAFMPRIGFGAYLYATDFYAGISATDMVTIDPSGFYKDPQSGEVIRPLNITATGGANIYLSSAWQMTPSAMIKYYQPSGVVADVSAGFLYLDKFSVGAGLRTNGSAMVFGMLQVSTSIKVAYSFQYMFANTALGSLGNNEAYVSYGQLW